MAFDISSAQPVKSGFDISSAKPVNQEPQSVGSKIWGALAWPEKKSREGLTMLTDALTPSMSDIESGKASTAGILGRTVGETLAQEAPKFISRGAILTSAALGGLKLAAPLIKSGVRSIGNQLEASSMPAKAEGALEAAYKDPSIIFSKGTEAAGPMYEAAKAELPSGANIFSGKYKPEEIIDAAQEYMAKGGVLEPSEALIARKAADVLLKSKRYVPDTIFELRNAYDQLAKASPNIAEADPTFVRGMQAEALQKWLPQNKLGGTSPFKIAVGKALGLLSAPVLSPRLQGYAAAGAGLASKFGAPIVESPINGLGIAQVLNRKQ